MKLFQKMWHAVTVRVRWYRHNPRILFPSPKDPVRLALLEKMARNHIFQAGKKILAAKERETRYHQETLRLEYSRDCSETSFLPWSFYREWRRKRLDGKISKEMGSFLTIWDLYKDTHLLQSDMPFPFFPKELHSSLSHRRRHNFLSEFSNL